MTDFFARTRELEQQGRPFATATVVRVDRPTSGRPGDKAIVTLEGDFHGWVGGSCARPTVVEEAAKALREDRCRLIRLSPEPDDSVGRAGITDLAMTCFSGGTMEIFIEPHQPKTKLVIVGDLPVARALEKLGEVLGLQVESGLSGTVDPLTFVVVATHGEHDEVALKEALDSSAPYVGLVASPRRADSIRSYLKSNGVSDEVVSRLRAPAGLDIQASSPEEIALSILAEIVHVRRNLDSIDWQPRSESAPSRKSSQPVPAAAAGAISIAIDPICGMTVETAGAKVTHKHAGVVYYFCCAGCREKFAASPEEVLSR